jgi:hypothetical protein
MSRYTKANHRVFMQFVRRDVWHVTFLEPGLQRPLPKTLTFRDEGKIRELARRGEAWQTSEDRQLLDYAIAKGEGRHLSATIARAVRKAETSLIMPPRRPGSGRPE